MKFNFFSSFKLLASLLSFCFFVSIRTSMGQSNTSLGHGAYNNQNDKFSIERVDVTSHGNYQLPTIDMQGVQGTWNFSYMTVQEYGVNFSGSYSTTSTSINPVLIGGHGSGAAVSWYEYDYDNISGLHYYEIYTSSNGSGYGPEITFSGGDGQATLSYYFLDQNRQLYIHANTNTPFTIAPQVNVSFGGATAVAVLSGSVSNGGNTAVGYQALAGNTSGNSNTAIGYQSGLNLTSGHLNTFVGNRAGWGITTGHGNTIIGGYLSDQASDLYNTVILADGNGHSRFYSNSSGNVFLGYGNNPNDNGYKLDVNGSGYFNSAVNLDSLVARSGVYFHGNRYGQPNTADFMQITYADGMHFRALPNNNYVLSLFKTGDSKFYGRVKGVSGAEPDDFVTKGQLDANSSNYVLNNGSGDFQFASSSTSLDFTKASVELRESNFSGNSNGAAPRISFHWGGVVASQIGIESSGRLAILNNPGTGYEDMVAKNFIASEGVTLASGHNLSWGGTYNNNAPTIASSSGGIYFYPEGQMSGEKMRISSNGNIGINTISPAEKLSVNGNIKAKAVKVDPTAWPDYVFEPAYLLTSLAETEIFIKENKHLPGVPSAKEVEHNGVDLGDISAILLKKIEELTLHQIALEKKIIEQGNIIKSLKQF